MRPSDGRASASESATADATAPATMTAATDGATTTTTEPQPTGGTGTASDREATSTTAVAGTGTGTEGSTGTTDTTGGPPKLDVGPDTGEPVCEPEDICCKMDGVIPPHELLDAFLAACPPADMPKTVAGVQAFEPEVDGHMMAWSDVNVGDELVDSQNGGVIEENIQTGRDLSRMAAELAVPAGATILEVREDPVIIEDLGTPPPCLGVGWGWGSILFEGADKSIGELVYLYIGQCSDGDVERFYYSDQSVEICPSPG